MTFTLGTFTKSGPRKDHRGVRSDFRCAAIRSVVVRGSQRRTRLREVSQPVT